MVPKLAASAVRVFGIFAVLPAAPEFFDPDGLILAQEEMKGTSEAAPTDMISERREVIPRGVLCLR
ncbi:hypothetical protein [Streptomyces sp. B3I7]|uniref:hypothetical protein n=1 Tax=Streptomyces sp. B3I7 TaxID=3042269 RepID=UPI0027D787BE|nr:hypothetical protein [Streptomyces sp. B3I7]